MQHHAYRQDHQETHRASSQAKQSVSANRNPGVYAGFKIGRKKNTYCIVLQSIVMVTISGKKEKKNIYQPSIVG